MENSPASVDMLPFTNFFPAVLNICILANPSGAEVMESITLPFTKAFSTGCAVPCHGSAIVANGIKKSLQMCNIPLKTLSLNFMYSRAKVMFELNWRLHVVAYLRHALQTGLQFYRPVPPIGAFV